MRQGFSCGVEAVKQALRANVVGLVAGALGGALGSLVGVPMPWLLGAITGTATAALAGLPVVVSNRLRDTMLVLIGLMIGMRLTPQSLTHVVSWPLSLFGIVLYVVVVVAVLYWALRRWAGFDTVTAFFAAAPGGFMAMAVIGREQGGSVRNIALFHSIRVVLVVFSIVLGYHLLLGTGRAGSHYVPLGRVDVVQAMGLAGLGLVGALLGYRLRLPAATMLGPLALAAAANMTGWLTGSMPTLPILLAEWVLGSSIGTDFAGVRLVELARRFATAAVATGFMLLMSVAFSLVLMPLTGVPFDALFLAFAPGGLSGVSLIALALGIQPAFVTTHTLLRVLLILLGGPLLFRLINRKHHRHSD